MIDTIKFSIPIDDATASAIVSKSVELRKYDNSINLERFKVYTTSINIGSYDYHINLFYSASSPNSCNLEFSVAKYFYGHNVYLLYFDGLLDVVDNVYNNLLLYLGTFPSYFHWHITRLDLCYAWKLPSQNTAENILSYIKTFTYPRKNKTVYTDSIMFSGRTYSVKWYLKSKEYFCHDFKQLLLRGQTDQAYHISNVADGVLRFEVSLRLSSLKRLLERDTIRLDHLSEDFILTTLQYYFAKSFNGLTTTTMNNIEVMDILLANFSHIKAFKLYTYYLSIVSGNPQDILNFKRCHSNTTCIIYKSTLKKLGIGLNSSSFPISFDLSIPSKNVVNMSNVV